MNIEIEEEGCVIRNGERVGAVDSKGNFHPVIGLHHKTAEKIRKQVSELQGGQGGKSSGSYPEEAGSTPAPATIPDSDPQPERGELGDIAPDLIEWRKRNWRPDLFAGLYPPHRLKALNREDLI